MEFLKKPYRPYLLLLVLLLLVNLLVFWGGGLQIQSLPTEPVTAEPDAVTRQ